jgi:hypothetical protein
MKICTQFYMVVAISFKKCIEKVVCSIVVAERCYTFRDNIQNCTTLCFLQRCYTVCEKLHKVTHNPETGQGLSIQFIVWVQILLFLYWSVHYIVSFYLSISSRTWLPNSEHDNLIRSTLLLEMYGMLGDSDSNHNALGICCLHQFCPFHMHKPEDSTLLLPIIVEADWANIDVSG